MYTRESIANSINWARDVHRNISESDAIRRYGNQEFADYEEAMQTAGKPKSATDSDIDAVIERWAAEAKRLRSFAESKQGAIPEYVRQRWLVRAEELADRCARLRGGQ